MTGGLLQIVTSGKQDVYLTIDPEITFFKKVFRKHTNFSLELREIKPEQQNCEYNNMVSFILNNGDAIHNLYLEIELPNLSFSDKFITNTKYTNRKLTQKQNYQIEKNKWSGLYDNLKGFCDVELSLYRNLKNLLKIENVTTTSLKDEVSRFNFKNKNTKDKYKNNVEEKVYLQINISEYINSINKLIQNAQPEDITDTTKFISKYEIDQNLDEMKNIMEEYLKFYNQKKLYYSDLINNIDKNLINFSYAEFLGHNFFDYITLEIGGIEVQKYQKEILHLNQMHRIKPNYMPNYLQMIGQTSELNDFNTDSKGNTKLTVPLIFWFNKDAGSSLPLVALQYASIIINAKITDVRNVICFENYEKMYESILKVKVDADTGFYPLDTDLIYDSYNIDLKDKTINYNCIFINQKLLEIQFPDLTASEIETLLENNGTEYSLNQITKILHPEMSDEDIELMNGVAGLETQYLIDKIEWVGFMIDIKNPIYESLAPKVGSYYPYINFNQYYSSVPEPKIKLISEMVFLDDVERSKFANSKLEYVVETFNEDTFNIKDREQFECELSFNYPCKELLWYLQPQIYYDGITENGPNTMLLFDPKAYFNSEPILKQNLSFNQLKVLKSDVDMNYYTYLLSYKYLNNILPQGVYYQSFCLYPEETQPSGTVNFRQIKGKQYSLELNKDFLNEYSDILNKLYKSDQKLIANKNSLTLKFIAKSYDLFVVHKGNAKLLFSN